MAWLKLTSKALYLMKGGKYASKVTLAQRDATKRSLSVPLNWFQGNSSDIPGAMIVSFRNNSPEPPPYTSFKITSYPQGGVQVDRRFTVEGTADVNNAGKPVLLTIDGLYKTTGPAVGKDGRWQVAFLFTQPGNRRLNLSVGGDSAEVAIAVCSPLRFSLNGSVGRGGRNLAGDVVAVKQQLLDLGFNWLRVNGSVDTGTVNAIKLFQAIANGRQHFSSRPGSGVDGRVDPNGFTHRWLQARNAPRWELMPIEGEGFFNHERKDNRDNHDYGTSWMAQTLIAAGKTYQASYRKSRPQATRIVINDVSVPYGGDTPDHYGHETGLSCDLLLPHKNGNYGTISWTSSSYDRNAMRAMLKALRQQSLSTLIYFNDTQLIREGLCVRARAHDDHAHFEIKPPRRLD